MNKKQFEVTIKTTILYPTFNFVELFDFDLDVASLIEDMFDGVNIEIKKDKNGITELEIINVKEVKDEQ